MSRRVPLTALLLGVAAVLLYAGAVPGGYALDDAGALLENPVVNREVPFHEAFLRDFWGRRPSVMGMYRPLVTLTYLLDRIVSHGNAWWSHGVNVALHAAVVVAMYLVGRRLFSERVAAAGALFFATFAAPAEAVQSLVGRADVLLGLCALVGLAGHRSHRRAGAWVAAGSLAVGLLSKESAVFVPVAWLVFDLLLPDPATPLRSRWRHYGVYALVIGGVAGMRFAALGTSFHPHGNALDSPIGTAQGLGRIFGAGRVFAERYLLGMADPFRRLYICSAPACHPSDVSDAVAWLGLILFLGLLLLPVLLRSRVPSLALGTAWFLVFFAPVSNLVIPATTSYAERLLYVPAIGASWALAAAMERLADQLRRPRLIWAALAALGLTNVIALQLRHRDWRTEDALYLSALDQAPDSAIVQANAAYAYYRQRDPVAAEEHARRALALWHPYSMATSVLASSLDRQGKATEADEQFRLALRQSNADSSIVADYARFLARHQRWDEAIQHLKNDLQREPLNTPQRALLKQIEAQRGRAASN